MAEKFVCGVFFADFLLENLKKGILHKNIRRFLVKQLLGVVEVALKTLFCVQQRKANIYNEKFCST